MSDAPVNTANEETSSEGLLDDIDNMLGGDAEAAPAAETAAPPAPAEQAQPDATPPSTEEAATAQSAEETPAPTAEAVPAAPEAAPETAPETVAPAAESAQEPVLEAAPEAAIAESDATATASERLVSETAAATSQAVLKEMMTAIPRQKVASPATRGGTTLEDLVIEAIRPFLTEWMDKNLATIVKQLVEKEIKHLIPRDVE